jgi:hypothetical protein
MGDWCGSVDRTHETKIRDAHIPAELLMARRIQAVLWGAQ